MYVIDKTLLDHDVICMEGVLINIVYPQTSCKIRSEFDCL